MLIWLGLAAVALLALAPLALSLFSVARVRGRREGALSLHRGQLEELNRDLAEHRLLPEEHTAARLEVQRRLLAEADRPDSDTRASSPWVLAAIGACVPAIALLIYLEDGGMPDYRQVAASVTEPAQTGAVAAKQAEDEQMVARLQASLAKLDPHSETTRKGYVMLGNAELELGRLPDAARAWRIALATRFDPQLGAITAEAITESEGHVTQEAATLFKRALAEAPADAPWRPDAQRRLTEAK